MTERERVETDDDFIVNPRCENSLSALLVRYKDEPVPDELIVKSLALESQEELDSLFEETKKKLRAYMGTSP